MSSTRICIYTHTHAHTKSWVKIITAEAVLQSVGLFAAFVVVIVIAELIRFIDAPLRYRYCKTYIFFSVCRIQNLSNPSLLLHLVWVLQINARTTKMRREKKTVCKEFLCLWVTKKKEKKKKPSTVECFEQHSHVTECSRYTGVI